MYYFPYERWEQIHFYTYKCLLYAHLVCRKSFTNNLLLLHNTAKSMIGIFHKNAQFSYNKRQKQSVKCFW